MGSILSTIRRAETAPACDPTDPAARSGETGTAHGRESVRIAAPYSRQTRDGGSRHRDERGPAESNCEGD